MPWSAVVEVAGVVTLEQLINLALTYLIASTAAVAIASALSRSRRLDASARRTIWAAALLLPPLTTMVGIASGGALALVTWGTPVAADHPVAAPVVAASVSVAVLIAMLVPLVHRWLFLSRIGPRQPASIDDHRLFASLNDPMVGSVRLSRADGLAVPAVLAQGEICLPGVPDVGLTRGQRRALMAHELAHVRHGDPLLLKVTSLVVAACWIQPLNRLAMRRLIAECELAADGSAVARGVGRRDLASALMGLAESGCAPVPSAAGGELRARIRALAKPSSPEPGVARVALLVSLAVMIGGMALLPVRHVAARDASNALPWLTPSKDPPNARMLELRAYQRRNR